MGAGSVRLEQRHTRRHPCPVFRGATIGEAHLIAVSTDPDLVRDVVTRLLEARHEQAADPAVRALEAGRREALAASISEAQK